MIDIQKKLLNNYQKRKKWFGDNRFQEQYEVFEIETGRAGIKKGDKLLEIGFGEGIFLDWAKVNGFDVTGVEINKDLYGLAKERGHNVYFGKATEALSEDERYDGVFLFDVLEHLKLDEIFELLYFLKKILTKDGKILARFPNGGSPFGRITQHGDATHVTILTGAKVQDISMLCGLEVKTVANGARTLRTGKNKKWFLKKIAYIIRDLLQFIIGYLYFGENIPLDPNLTVIIGHNIEDK